MLREQHRQKTSATVARLALSTLPERVFRMLFAVSVLITASFSLSAQTIGVSPANLTFAKQAVGSTSAAKAVTITNNGASQAVNIATSGDFTETDNCGGIIAGGGSCNMNVFLAPTTMGDISGAAAIRDNSGNLLAFVVLAGTGTAPVTTSPASLAFGSVPIGTLSAAKTFKITNDTSGSVNLISITGSSDYLIDTGSCLTESLAPLKSCTVSVRVQPTAATDDGAIVVTDNASGGIPLVVALSATGSGAANAPLSLSAASLTFKSAAGGLSAAQSVAVTNISGSAVTMGAMSASSDYSVTSTCPAAGNSLAAGGTCSISITFAPQFVGKIGGAVAVGYAGTNSPQLVNLSGTSVPVLTVAPPSLNFGAQNVGTVSVAKSVKITNNSASAVSINSVVPSGDFTIRRSGTTCSLNDGALGAGESCILKVQYAPTVTGASNGSLWVANSGDSNPLRILLSGNPLYGQTASAVLTPSSAHQGSAETIVITGTSTNFVPGTTVNFGADITTGTVSVNGPTSASVPIAIDNVAALGSRSVTITSGAQVVTATFSVVAGVPAVSLINPNMIKPTQTESVAITGVFTNWTSGTTQANFGAGIAVGGAAAGAFGPVTVNSVTSLTASLVTSGATNGLRNVQIQTGGQTLTVVNGIDVETCNGTTPTVVSISPANNTSGVPLNAQVQVQFSAPMNRSTFSLGNSGASTIFFYDNTSSQEVPGTISVDASGTIATITPSESLPAGRQFTVYLSYRNYVQDICGDNLPSQTYTFYTAFGDNQAGPTLTSTSPENGDTNIPLSNGSSRSTPVVLQFNDQLDPITAQNGFSMTAGGNAVAGTFSYSANDQVVSFTPASPLTASTTYTVNYSAVITDTVGNPLTNPGSFSFTTGTSAVTTGPTVTLVDPANGAVNVGLNVTPHVEFSEAVNELTIPTALVLYYQDYYQGYATIPSTVTVAANRLSATITPSAALLPNTQYEVYLCGFTDIAGNAGSCFSSTFWTGTSTDTSHATVSTISPGNTQTGVPLNADIVAVMSATIDPTTITNSAITVTPSGGTAIAGTVTLAADGVTLTFAPAAALTASKLYNVSVGGFNDVGGNSVTTFTSSFTTGTAGYGSGSFTVSSTSPANGATGVSVTSPVTITMSNLIDAASVNPNTVFVYVYSSNQVVAGTYSVSGASVTFTPLTQYPANTQMAMGVYGLADEAGNLDYQYPYTFTTANTVDHTAPTVTISPSNGATNVGLNTQVVLTFSKSINPGTITASTVSLFNGDAAVNYGYSVSRDNRTLVLNASAGQLPSGATITVALTSGVQDLSGNALAATTSQFTLTTVQSGGAPSVVVMRPGNGATNVPANTVVTLFTNAALNASTVTGALNVTDNGVVVTGTVQVNGNGQAIEFTPAAAFNPGDLIQVFLGPGAQSTDGVGVSSFGGQFTVAGSPLSTAAQVQAVNPWYNATNVPVNTVLDVEYNQALLPVTVNNVNVTLRQYNTGVYQTVTVSLVGGGQVIQILPTSNLAANVAYYACVGGVTDIDGVPVANYCLYFTTGTAIDTAAPTVVSVAPPNGFTNIGTNAGVSVTFNKAINPVSVTGSTIQLSAGATTETPSSISFSSDYARVSITPQAPLPPSTQMTVAINGVTSQAGTAVTTQSTTFTTMAGPDFTAPYVVNASVQNNQTVGTNAAFAMQFNKPIDEGSLDGATIGVGSCCWTPLPATISWSADQTTVFITPTNPLAPSSQYYLFSFGLADLAGNPQSGFDVYFNTGTGTATTGPAVQLVSPPSGATGVPINAPVDILFNEPISSASLTGVTLKQGSTAVPTTTSLYDGDQGVQLVPRVPLTPGTTYTINVTGVVDITGNAQSPFSSVSFTTGTGIDLVQPTIVSTSPTNGQSNVPDNTTCQVVFSEPMDPAYFDPNNSLTLRTSSNVVVPATITFSANYTTATLTPTSALTGGGATYYFEIGYNPPYLYDLGGNQLAGTYITFTTH